MKTLNIKSPLDEETIKELKAGDQVLITGVIYTARDAAHKRLVEALDKGEKLPFDLTNQTVYYMGPSPAKPGQVIGSAGPTTSGRMDSYAPRLMAAGLKGMIGKGNRSQAVKDAIQKYKAIYFAAIGGQQTTQVADIVTPFPIKMTWSKQRFVFHCTLLWQPSEKRRSRDGASRARRKAGAGKAWRQKSDGPIVPLP